MQRVFMNKIWKIKININEFKNNKISKDIKSAFPDATLVDIVEDKDKQMNNFSDMLSKAKAMQEKMKEAQDQIKKIEVEGMSGGNLVRVVLTGDYEIKLIEISEAGKKRKSRYN